MAPNGKLRICVLQSSYEGSGSELAGLDPYRTPEIHDTEGKYEWHHEYIRKASSLSQIRALAHSKKFDVFLNLCDGAEDEDRAGKDVVLALERYGCAYTGADTISYEPTKELMKKMAYYYNIDTAPWTFIYDVDMQDDTVALAQVQESAANLKYPLIVKHFQGYSSVGMGPDCKVHDATQLMQQVRKMVSTYGGALVEEFISGREFTVLVVENDQDPDSPHTLIPVECLFQSGAEAASEQFKHFDLKWKDYESISWIPVNADKEPELDKGLRQAAAKAFVSTRACSYGRCDFRVDAQGRIYYLEINDNCGIFYPADQMGSADIILSLDPHMRHLEFIDHILACALARQQKKVKSKLVEPRYKHGVGYGMYVTRDIAPGEVVIKYEETPFVLVTRQHIANTFGPDAVPGPSPVDMPAQHINGNDAGAHANGSTSQQSHDNAVDIVRSLGSTGTDFKQLKASWFKAYAFPVSDEVWVTWSENPDDWVPMNHSCDPNTWLVGLDLVARRPIKKGEHVTADYCTYSVHNMNEFQCQCGATKCRGLIKGNDYLEDWVDEEYGDHISAYVATKRAQLKAQQAQHKAAEALLQ